MKYALVALLAFAFSSCKTTAGEPVAYTSDGVTLKGYLAYDTSSTARRPGILVVHEWWGHNDYARKRADMLAEMGYTALAVDMYGEGKQANHPEEAGRFAKEASADFDLKSKRFMAALNVLKGHKTVDPDRIAAIGYCFGGSVVLDMARSGADLAGVVSFHGALATGHPAQAGSVRARILVCHGADDKFVPAEQVEAFKKEMTDAGADFRFIAYENAVHSFTNPEADTYAKTFTIPIGYNAEADRKSWADMKAFFDELF
jgi:dienelactone hydrolase